MINEGKKDKINSKTEMKKTITKKNNIKMEKVKMSLYHMFLLSKNHFTQISSRSPATRPLRRPRP